MGKRLFLVTLVALVIAGCSKGDSGQGLSGGAPDFTLPAVDGSMVSMSDYKGKVVLVDFWATWCPPCQEMIPILSKLHKRYSKEGLVILGVSLDRDGLGELGTFVHENMIQYKVVMGDNRISNAFGGVSSIPTLYIVDREGRLVRKLTGYHTYGQLEEQVKKYL
jgi:cytochrome c biogenesis protein CcmG/thiol:disulfide interchange protein DsbE